MATIGAAGQPASAREPDGTPVVFGMPLDDYLEHFPDATRLSDGSYLLEPGRRLYLPQDQSDVGAAGVYGCWDEWFCVWEHSDFSGAKEEFYYCQTYRLYGTRDVVSSMYNDQNSYSATFWDTNPSPDVQGKLRPNSYLRNLAWDLAPDGGNWNDRIDEVRPC